MSVAGRLHNSSFTILQIRIRPQSVSINACADLNSFIRFSIASSFSSPMLNTSAFFESDLNSSNIIGAIISGAMVRNRPNEFCLAGRQILS